MRNSNATHVDFGFLRGSVKQNEAIIPSNVDMILETNFHFLIGEWKRDGEEVSKGQKILLNRMSTLPNFIVLIINGFSDNDNRVINDFYELHDSFLKKKGNGEYELKEYIDKWFINANRLKVLAHHKGIAPHRLSL